MKKKELIQFIKKTVQEVKSDAYGDATLTSQGQSIHRAPGVWEQANEELADLKDQLANLYQEMEEEIMKAGEHIKGGGPVTDYYADPIEKLEKEIRALEGGSKGGASYDEVSLKSKLVGFKDASEYKDGKITIYPDMGEMRWKTRSSQYIKFGLVEGELQFFSAFGMRASYDFLKQALPELPPMGESSYSGMMNASADHVYGTGMAVDLDTAKAMVQAMNKGLDAERKSQSAFYTREPGSGGTGIDEQLGPRMSNPRPTGPSDNRSSKDIEFDNAQAMDRLTPDDRDKMGKIQQMMDKEKGMDPNAMQYERVTFVYSEQGGRFYGLDVYESKDQIQPSAKLRYDEANEWLKDTLHYIHEDDLIPKKYNSGLEDLDLIVDRLKELNIKADYNDFMDVSESKKYLKNEQAPPPPPPGGGKGGPPGGAPGGGEPQDPDSKAEKRELEALEKEKFNIKIKYLAKKKAKASNKASQAAGQAIKGIDKQISAMMKQRSSVGTQQPGAGAPQPQKENKIMKTNKLLSDYLNENKNTNLQSSMNNHRKTAKRQMLMEGAMKQFFEYFDAGKTDEEVVHTYAQQGVNVPEQFVSKARKQYENLTKLKMELEMTEKEFKNTASDFVNNPSTGEMDMLDDDKQLASGFSSNKI